MPQMDDVRDLNRYLDEIWQTSFADVPRVNQVTIAYCHPWKRRLGFIRLSGDSAISLIGINTLLQLPQVPEYILLTTIAHELAHYAHGFGSPLPCLYKHPHANNVVTRELEQRGLGEPMRLCNAWINRQWFCFFEERKQAGFPGLLASSELAPQ